MTSIRSSARSVPSIACSRIVLQVALRVVVLGEDEDAAVVPLGAAPCGPLAEGRQVRDIGSRGSSRPGAAPGVGQVPRLLGDLRHLVEQRLLAAPQLLCRCIVAVASASAAAVTASICASSSASSSSSVSSPRSSSASGAVGEELAPDRRSPSRLAGCRRCLAPTGARRCGGGPRGCGRTPRSTTADAAAGRRRAARRRPARGSRCSRSAPRELCGTRPAGARAEFGGVVGQAVDRQRARRFASGNPPWTSRMSSLSRRTITSSSAFLPRTFTPRQKRCGSRISSRAEKLLEWPLCGVAERNSRCSNRPPRSRIARVNLESMA